MNEENEETTLTQNGLSLNRMISIQARTWPGINKPAVSGRITKLHFKDKNNREKVTHVDVQYVVVRGREKEVSVEYITAAPELEAHGSTTLRDRGRILGRCSHCGSLRRDCGSCDIRIRSRGEWKQHTKEKINKISKKNDDSSSSEGETKKFLRKVGRRQRIYRKWRKEMNVNNVSIQKELDRKVENFCSNDSSDSDTPLALMLNHRLNKKKFKAWQKKNAICDDEDELPLSSFHEKWQEKKTVGENDDYNELPLSYFRKEMQKKSTVAGDDDDDDDDDDKLHSPSIQGEKISKKKMESLVNTECERINDFSDNASQDSSDFFTPSYSESGMSYDERDDDDSIIFRNDYDMTEKTKTSLLNFTPPKTKERTNILDVTIPTEKEVDNNDNFLDADYSSESSIEKVTQPKKMKQASLMNKIRTIQKDSNLILNENNDFLEGFLQPEGDAQYLPSDIQDKTASLPDEELIPLFDSIVQNLQDKLIPEAQHEIKTCNFTSSFQWKQLYNHLRDTLIRNGTDQLRACAARLTNRSKFAKQLDIRDLTLEQIDCSVEDIMRPLKKIISRAVLEEEEVVAAQASMDLDDTNRSDYESDFFFSSDDRQTSSSYHEIGSWNHPYSSRKRNNNNISKSHRKREKSRKKNAIKKTRKNDNKTTSKANYKKHRNLKSKETIVSDESDGKKVMSESSRDEQSSDDEYPTFSEASTHLPTKGKRLRDSGVSFMRKKDSDMSRKNFRDFLGAHDNKYSRVRHSFNPGVVEETNDVDQLSFFPSIKELLHKLKNPERNIFQSERNEVSVSMEDILTIRHEINSSLSENPENALAYFDYLQQMIHTLSERSETSPELEAVNEIITTLMTQHGYKTLLQLLNEPNTTVDIFKFHIKLLQTATIFAKMASILKTNFFFHRKQNDFMDVMVLQIIDIIYAILLPEVWIIPNFQRKTWWCLLEPLAYSLNYSIERISSIIWSKLLQPKQYIIVDDDEKIAITSCVCPSAYDNFIKAQCESWPSSQNEARIKILLKRNILEENKEEKVLWSIFAYLSRFYKPVKGDLIQEQSKTRWKIIKFMLFREPSDKNLCSDKFVSKWKKWLGYLVQLMDSKVLNPLPEDAFMIHLIEKTLKIWLSSTTSGNEARPSYSPDIERLLIRILIMTQTDDTTYSNPNVDLLLKVDMDSVKVEMDRIDHLINILFASDFDIIRICEKFINAWRRLLFSKKAKKVRFERAIQDLVTNLVKTVPPCSLSDSKLRPLISGVSSIFPSDIDNKGKRLSKKSKHAIYREAASFILFDSIFSSILSDNATCVRKVVNQNFCAKLWKYMAIGNMVEFQKYFYAQIQGLTKFSIPTKGETLSPPISLVYFSFKMNTRIILVLLNGNGNNLDKDIYCFMLSIWFTCLYCSAQQLQASAKNQLNLSPVVDPLSAPSTATCLQIITSMNLLFSFVVRQNNKNEDFCIILQSTLPLLLLIIKDLLERMTQFLLPPLTDDGNRTMNLCFRSVFSLLSSVSESFLKSQLEEKERNETQELAEEIPDEELMNIDLESLISEAKRNKVHDTEDIYEAEKFKRKDSLRHLVDSHLSMLNYLKIIVAEAKPSKRFSTHDENSLMRNYGKELIERNMDVVCSYLVRISAIIFLLGDNQLQCREPFFHFVGSSAVQDRIYFQNANAYIAEKLCLFVRKNPHLLKLHFPSSFKMVLNSFLYCITDCRILHCFPSSDFNLTMKVGGKKAHDKEAYKLFIMQEAAARQQNREQSFLLDIDSIALSKKWKKNLSLSFSSYFSCHLWSFGESIGFLMKQFAEKLHLLNSDDTKDRFNIKLKSMIMDISEILETGNKFNQCSTRKGLPPRSSMENECLKRIFTLNDFALKVFSMNEVDLLQMQNSLQVSLMDFICTVMRSILVQLLSIFESVIYFGRKKRKFAQSKSLLNAYSEIICSYLSLLLRLVNADDFSNKTMNNHIEFFRNFILVPILDRNKDTVSDIVSAIKISSTGGNNARCIPSVNFDLDSDKKLISSESSCHNLLTPLQKALNRRILELLLHTASGNSASLSSTLSLCNAIFCLERGYNKNENDIDLFEFSSRVGLSLSLTCSSDWFESKSMLQKCIDVYFSEKNKELLAKNRIDFESPFYRPFFGSVFKNRLISKLMCSRVTLREKCLVLTTIHSMIEVLTIGQKFVTVDFHSDSVACFSLDGFCVIMKALTLCIRELSYCHGNHYGQMMFRLILLVAYELLSFGVKEESTQNLKIYCWAKVFVGYQFDIEPTKQAAYSEIRQRAEFVLTFFEIMNSTCKIILESSSLSYWSSLFYEPKMQRVENREATNYMDKFIKLEKLGGVILCSNKNALSFRGNMPKNPYRKLNSVSRINSLSLHVQPDQVLENDSILLARKFVTQVDNVVVNNNQ